MKVFKDRSACLRELLASAEGFGDMEHIVCGDLRMSFSSLLGAVASTAKVLREEFGVGHGDRVAILAENCPQWIISFWAAISLGAIASGLNGWWVRDEILYGLRDSDPKVLIADAKRLARIEGSRHGLPVISVDNDFPAIWDRHAGAGLPEDTICEDDAATILYTSGTTGRPRGAVSTHGNIIALTRVYAFHGLRALLMAAERDDGPSPSPANCSLNTTPLFHVSGLFAGVVTALMGGLKTVWTWGRFDPVEVMKLIESEKVTSWGPMGTMVHRVMSHPDLPDYDLSSMQNIGSGGAPVSAQLLERMREVFPNAKRSLAVGYGLTETTSMVTVSFGDELADDPNSVGEPLPTIEIEIRDGEGRPLAEGKEGEIHVRGPLVMKQYWRRPRETAATILKGRWLKTGDIGLMKNGRLYISSRKRDLILRGGENIYPAEIEQCLEKHPAVAEAAVLGVEHEELGQEVKAVVVLKKETTVGPAELRSWVAERLAYFKVPAHWELRTESLPRNPAGKVLKTVLAGEAESSFVEE